MSNFEIIQRAIKENLIVKAVYNGKTRTLQPDHLMKEGEAVCSFEEESGQPKTMNIEGLENLELTSSHFSTAACMMKKSKVSA